MIVYKKKYSFSYVNALVFTYTYESLLHISSKKMDKTANSLIKTNFVGLKNAIIFVQYVVVTCVYEVNV